MPVSVIPAAVAPTGIKSIQRGVITIAPSAVSNTAAIAAVNTAKAELRFLGMSGDSAQSWTFPWLTLTNANTVTAARKNATIMEQSVSWELTEWY